MGWCLRTEIVEPFSGGVLGYSRPLRLPSYVFLPSGALDVGPLFSLPVFG